MAYRITSRVLTFIAEAWALGPEGLRELAGLDSQKPTGTYAAPGIILRILGSSGCGEAGGLVASARRWGVPTRQSAP